MWTGQYRIYTVENNCLWVHILGGCTLIIKMLHVIGEIQMVIDDAEKQCEVKHEKEISGN